MDKTTARLLKALDGTPTSKANTFLRKYLEGEELSKRQAIEAKCSDCMGYWEEGRFDCRMKHCSLYPYSPYKGKFPSSKSMAQQ